MGKKEPGVTTRRIDEHRLKEIGTMPTHIERQVKRHVPEEKTKNEETPADREIVRRVDVCLCARSLDDFSFLFSYLF